MNNTVCRNFEYNEKADGTLDSIHLNCDKCEFNGHCDIKTAYYNAKDYAVSIEFVSMKETEVHPINENIVKGFEEFTKMMFRQGLAEREDEK